MRRGKFQGPETFGAAQRGRLFGSEGKQNPILFVPSEVGTAQYWRWPVASSGLKTGIDSTGFIITSGISRSVDFW